MPVYIAGMHRSGTSMVTRLLNVSGLYIGSKDNIQKPSKTTNPEGHWENLDFQHLNKELLDKEGGAWDFPVSLQDGWELKDEFSDIREKAEGLIQDFNGCEPWGWKDPRNSLTLPFWKNLIPDLKVVYCIRNPLDVCRSLKKRNNMSQWLAFNLWQTYNKNLISATCPEERIITHYDSYFIDPRGELTRLLNFLDWENPAELIESACGTISATLRHSQSTRKDIIDAGAPDKLLELYDQLCSEAGPFLSGSGAVDISQKSDMPGNEVCNSAGVEHAPFVPRFFVDETRLSRIYNEVKLNTDTFIAELEKTIKDKNNRISENDKLIEERDARITRLESLVTDSSRDWEEISNKMEQINDALPALEDVLEGLKEENISSSTAVKTGELCFTLGLTGSSEYFFKKALSIAPDNVEALNNLGVTSMHYGDSRVAERYFKDALRLDPVNKEARFNLDSLVEVCTTAATALCTPEDSGYIEPAASKSAVTYKPQDSKHIHDRIHALLEYCGRNRHEGISQHSLFRQGVKGFDYNGSSRVQAHISPGHDDFLLRCLDRSGTAILDMGCGNGNFGVFLLKNKNPQPYYFGIDSDESRIKVLRENYHLQGMEWNIIEFNADLAGKFDTIILNQVIEHLELQDVKKLFSVCKQYKVEKVLMSTPSIEQLSVLAYYNIFPESLTYTNHKTFWTKTMLNTLLKNSFDHAKSIEIGEYCRCFPFITEEEIYYHLYAEIKL